MRSERLTKIDLEAKKINQALNDQHQEAVRQLNSMVGGLQDAKVERKSLAAFFSQYRADMYNSSSIRFTY